MSGPGTVCAALVGLVATEPSSCRSCTGSHRPFWNSKVTGYARVNPAQPGHLTGFSLHTTIHSPSPRTVRQARSAQGNSRSSRVAGKCRAGPPWLTLCGKAGYKDHWPGPQGLREGLSAEESISLIQDRSCFNKQVPSPPPDTSQGRDDGQSNQTRVQRPPWPEEPQLYKVVVFLTYAYANFILSLMRDGDSKRHIKKGEEPGEGREDMEPSTPPNARPPVPA